jgi:uncharacterized cupredoxin-like copper-binding protein
MVIYLTFLAIVSLIFLIMLFINYRRTIIKGRPERLAAVRIVVSWILLITLVSSGGGAVYAAIHHNKLVNEAKTAKVTKKAEKLDDLNIEFTPKKPTLKNGKVEVKFKVSQKTRVKIIRLDGKKTVKIFNNVNKKTDAQFKYTFKKNGKYNVIATRDGRKMVKCLTIKTPKEDKMASSNSSESNGRSSNTSFSSSSKNTTKSKASGSQSTGSSYTDHYVSSDSYGDSNGNAATRNGSDTGVTPDTSHTAPATSDSGVDEEYVPSGN